MSICTLRRGQILNVETGLRLLFENWQRSGEGVLMLMMFFHHVRRQGEAFLLQASFHFSHERFAARFGGFENALLDLRAFGRAGPGDERFAFLFLVNQSVDDVDEGAVLAQIFHFDFDAFPLFLGLAAFGARIAHTVFFVASTLATAFASVAFSAAVTATFASVAALASVSFSAALVSAAVAAFASLLRFLAMAGRCGVALRFGAGDASLLRFLAVASGRRVAFRFGAGAGAAVVGAVVAFVMTLRAAFVVFAVSTFAVFAVSALAVMSAFHAAAGLVAGAAALLGGRRRFGGMHLAGLAAFAAARRGGVVVSLVVRFFLVHFVTRFLHHDLGDTLFDVGRVLNKAFVDGRLRFGFRFDEIRIGVGVFGDRNSAFVRGVPFSVAIGRIIGRACLERLFHAIFDHLHFGTGLDGEHASVFHFHLFAA